MAKIVLSVEVNGVHVRGGPRLGWFDGVKVALVSRGMTVEKNKQKYGRNGEPWCICR